MQPLRTLIPATNITGALTYPATTGGGNVIPVPNWMPSRGPNGYPYYCRGVNVHYEIQVDTDGSASVDSPDWWRWLNGFAVVLIDGTRRFPGDMTGDQILAALEEFAGVENQKYHPDIAVSQTNATRKLTFHIPFTSPLLYAPDDDEIMVDLISRFEIKPPDLTSAGVAVAGGVITLDSMTIRFEADLVERDYLKWTAPLEFVAKPFSGSDASLTVEGLNCRVMGLGIHKRGAAGGGSLTNLTTVLLPGLNTEHLTRDPDLKEHYLALRGYAAGGAAADQGVSRVASLVATDRYCPLQWANQMEKAWSGDVVKKITVKCVEASAIADKVLLMRNRLPRSLAIHKAIAATFNKGNELPFRIATEKKTRKENAKWPAALRDYMPMVCPVPGMPGYKSGR